LKGYRDRRQAGVIVALLAICLIWVGLLIGVSFLATPVKFMAPSLSLLTGLDVGRHTFMVFNQIEVALAVVILTLATARWELLTGITAFWVSVIVFVQSTAVLPALGARTEALIRGEFLEPSSLHTAYIALDIVKLLVLGGLVAISFHHLLCGKSAGQRLRKG
jgi:hypothetical protein